MELLLLVSGWFEVPWCDAIRRCTALTCTPSLCVGGDIQCPLLVGLVKVGDREDQRLGYRLVGYDG